ncbi:EscU/YscU/HrcU family type III secretion system export apparatus switch protein [Tundrisphaera sp. TA3]|uniref:EscU/YscU/HrcU family type III secretion system export apparatus switch protein n=1 Tax=Tundrisphaera sp. TA3 TaxID=3435775 RepID=UPI003EB745EB
MSEDRTHAPSKRRRMLAREQGQVARSPDLTGAAGLLAATALLGIWGDDLTLALVGLVREPWQVGLLGTGGAAEVVDRLRRSAFAIGGPLAGIVGGSAVAAILAHQAQVGGLFLPGMLAPDPTRFANFGGPGLSTRFGRGVWGLLKAAAVVAVGLALIRSNLVDLHRVGRLGPSQLAHAAAGTLRLMAGALAATSLILGLIDFVLQHRRVEAMLQMTPDQHREDERAADGDPALRSRRRRLARAWRGDAPELFAGATLVVSGPKGLAVILAGGPPPKRVVVRSSAKGAAGASLLRAAERAGLTPVAAPELAIRLARLPSPVVPPEVWIGPGRHWPAATRAAGRQE